ncbi:hypothetical protein GP486_006517 [Trichoglossum hirsutum]|uniref:Mcm2 3 5 family protein n=1 Tax=Trichoglossum hirsutum TaxID=265104 RepID=A0A9P8IGT6_9PEZI|nr:hypothetical protein GP486_006517 [Trichoglossum hirsutum]
MSFSAGSDHLDLKHSNGSRGWSRAETPRNHEEQEELSPGSVDYDHGDYAGSTSVRGLAISGIRPRIDRVPVGSKRSPRATDPLLSPPPAQPPRSLNQSPGARSSAYSYVSGDSLLDSLKKPTEVKCKTKRSFYQSRGNCLAVTITILAIYSTIFSGIYLVIAATKPSYGNKIHTKRGSSKGGISLSTATLLSTFFARTIELSFVTVFVAFLGQVLSRRAFRKESRGITIAEMAMRSWIMQPGSMIVHWESVRYAALTFLGVVSLTAAMLAMLYTTAAEALVAPKLKLGQFENKLMFGLVTSKYAYPTYVADHCKTPVQQSFDSDKGTTCLSIDHAGQAFHNYGQYLATWAALANAGNTTLTSLSQRPAPVGMLYDNTTVAGSWIEIRDTTEESQAAGRIINNVTMAMPHAGIFDAARDQKNDIMQPEDLEGLGEYSIYASLPSPSVNVLCVGMTKDEVKPFIQTEWPNSTIPFYPDPLNKTAVDDIFGFGKKYGIHNVSRTPPIFPRYPLDYNTILNTTGWYADSIYLLGKSATADPPYVLCSLRSSLSPNCSTRYNVTFSGGMLSSHCEDESDPQMYYHNHPEAPIGWVEFDWKNIASEWGNALSLNAGVENGNASVARLLTESILGSDSDVPANKLNPNMPSIAESLAALAGCTLLISARDAPFVHNWQHSDKLDQLNPPQYQNFSAIMRRQQYQSGGALGWQGVFYAVLVLVFVTNILCLASLLFWRGQVTDFTEPQNLFALSINSPPSQRIAGSCGGGPEPDHLTVGWYVNVQGDHVFLENNQEDEKELEREDAAFQKMQEEESPILASYSALANRKSGSFWERV